MKTKFTKIFATGLLVAGFALPVMAADQATKIRVDGMTCPFCAATSESALKKIDGVKSVHTDLEKGVITVCANDKADLKEANLKALLLEKGFTYVSKEETGTCKKT